MNIYMSNSIPNSPHTVSSCVSHIFFLSNKNFGVWARSQNKVEATEKKNIIFVADYAQIADTPKTTTNAKQTQKKRVRGRYNSSKRQLLFKLLLLTLPMLMVTDPNNNEIKLDRIISI